MPLLPTELLILLPLLWVMPLVLLYVVIRLGVRHGVMDAHRRESESRGV